MTMDDVYSQRNRLAIGFCKAALAAGWKAGVRFDKDHVEWEDDWRHVVIVKLPSGKQISWHMSPKELPLIKDLPEFDEPWDGTFLSNEEDWVKYI
jgi:hypothetical protein